MGKKTKTNPRNRPVSEADVKRAKKAGQHEALKTVLYMLLFILVEKEGYTHEQLSKVQDELNYLSDSVARGYVKWDDIRRVLEEEYDVHLALE